MFLAIGAFFLDWRFNLAVLAVLLAITAFYGWKSLKRALRNLLALGLFTLPVLLVRLFTVKEGMLIRFGFIEVYSLAAVQTLNSALRVFIIALVSFIVLAVWFPVKEWKKAKEKHVLLDILFTSIELYQDMIVEFVTYFRSKEKKKSVIDYIDNAYLGKIPEKTLKK